MGPQPAFDRRERQRPAMSIGEVLSALRPEYPEVTISKIRFLEDQGLVSPERAPSGYRRFTSDDVDRLRYILAVQRDHYLPLRVIREHLEARDRGREPAPIGADARAELRGGEPARPTAGEASASSPEVRTRFTRAELCRAAESDEATLGALESYGLLSAGADGRYDDAALVILRTSAALSAFGIEARHLRAFRTAAEREADLVAQIVAPLRQTRGGQGGHAEEVAREVSGLALRLHEALLRSALRAHY